ncbi:MAG: hypothetical protein HOQ24_14065 [Mycobacteriaceae bacterium]|nr:hypothetical protein [Mycobacteriaceae bacterium]
MALLVVAVGAGGYVLLSRSDGAGSAGGSPRKAAEAFVNAKADKKGLLCAADRKLIEGANGSSSYATGNPADMPDVNAKATLDSVDVADGSDKGTFTVKLDVKIGSRNHSQSATYDLVRENGDWKVCGILSAAPSF